MGKNNKKILIVEDDNAIRSMYKIKFEADGFEVFGADNGSDGLKIAEKEKPEFILLDVILPGLDGFSLLEKLRSQKKFKKSYIVMLTNLGTEEDKKKGIEMGADDYLVKASLTPAQISEKMKKQLKK